MAATGNRRQRLPFAAHANARARVCVCVCVHRRPSVFTWELYSLRTRGAHARSKGESFWGLFVSKSGARTGATTAVFVRTSLKFTRVAEQKGSTQEGTCVLMSHSLFVRWPSAVEQAGATGSGVFRWHITAASGASAAAAAAACSAGNVQCVCEKEFPDKHRSALSVSTTS